MVLNRPLNLIFAGALLAALIFYVDVVTPRGVADGMLYILLIIPTLWTRANGYTIYAGLAATALTIWGFLLSPSEQEQSFPVINRVMSTATVWLAVLLLTWYKRERDRARELADRWDRFFHRVDQGIIVINSDHEIVQANPAACALSGHEASSLSGLRIDELMKPDTSSGAGCSDALSKRGDDGTLTPDEILCRLKRKDGSLSELSVHICGFDREAGLRALFISDISESLRQKKELMETKARLEVYAGRLESAKNGLEDRVRQRTAELEDAVERLANMSMSYQHECAKAQNAMIALREREHLLNAIADNYPNGLLCIIGKDRRYVLARGKDPGLASGHPSSLVGSVFIPLRYHDQQEFVESVLARGFGGEDIEFSYSDPLSGRSYHVNGVPLGQTNGMAGQLLLVTQDVTDKNRMEHNIRMALAKERELNEVKTRFVTTASHEFRTPLGAILSSASLLGMYNGEGDLEKRQKHVRRISASVSHLTSLLNDFLSIGRIESGNLQPRLQPIELIELVHEVVEELGLVRAPGQTIRVHAPESPVLLHSDVQMLRAILINLLSNALKYSPPDAEALLEISTNGTSLDLKVKNTGIGIPEEEQGRLFETFFRASNVEHIGGTGLGLHIVKRYVGLLGGSICFSSRPGEETVFEVCLKDVCAEPAHG